MWAACTIVVASLWVLVQWISLYAPYTPPTLLHALSNLERAGTPSRLPRQVLPQHYNVTILTDLDALKFQGAVNASLQVMNDTNEFTFNVGRDLNLSSVRVATHLGTFVLRPQRDLEHERASVHIPVVLHENTNLSILMGFSAKMKSNRMGYYYADWTHKDTHGHYALTQFEPTAARTAFPCWDEPDLKATFEVHLLHRNATTALSNMPNITASYSVTADQILSALHAHPLRFEKPVLSNATWVRTDFEKTPPMSTYLLAFANGMLEHVDGSFLSSSRRPAIPIPLHAYATPEYVSKTHHIVDVMKRVMPFYERVYSIAYPLPKLDMLIAKSFDSEAMENWGLITGRSTTFLVDHAVSSSNAINTATRIVGHETAHMWFGDIATMAWWDDLWLNEAFATYMGEVVSMSAVYPETDWIGEFAHTELNRALDLDAKRSSHPIQLALKGENVEDAISQVFDAISYSKGASVLRMLSHMIGQDTFIQGVSQYLTKHLYGNTITEDLWKSMSNVSGVNVSTIMSDWIQQQGFPLLTVTEGQDSIHIRQSRFFETGDAQPDEDTTLWHIPLALKTIRHGLVETHNFTLDRKRSIEVPILPDTIWKLNADLIGAYRVVYSSEHLRKLIEAKALLSPLDRLGLVSDSLRLAIAGYASTPDALDILLAFRNDSSAQVQRTMAEIWVHVKSMCWEQPAALQHALNKLGVDLFGSFARVLADRSDLEEPNEIRLLRTFVLEAASDANDPWTLTYMQDLFAEHVRNNRRVPLHPDLRSTILKHGVKNGGLRAYEAVLRFYYEADDPSYKLDALLALCYAQDDTLVRRSVDLAFSNDVQKQDLLDVVRALSMNPKSRRLLWTFLKARMHELIESFSGNLTLVRLITAALSTFTSDMDAIDIEQFFAHTHTSQFDMGLSQALETIRAQAQWLERDVKDLSAWLSMRGYL